MPWCVTLCATLRVAASVMHRNKLPAGVRALWCVTSVTQDMISWNVLVNMIMSAQQNDFACSTPHDICHAITDVLSCWSIVAAHANKCGSCRSLWCASLVTIYETLVPCRVVYATHGVVWWGFDTATARCSAPGAVIVVGVGHTVPERAPVLHTHMTCLPFCPRFCHWP